MEEVRYFVNLEKAKAFIKANNIKFFHYETPLYLEKGIDVVIEKTFKCEICHEITPIRCEGSEPNTCAMCMPPEKQRNLGQKDTNGSTLDYFI